MFKKLVALFGKKAFADLDNDGKIESYREEVQGVFAQFRKQFDKLEEVNVKLSTIVEEERQNAVLAEKRAEKALQEHSMNEKLKDRLKDFVI
jgi:hypothetical protein